MFSSHSDVVGGAPHYGAVLSFGGTETPQEMKAIADALVRAVAYVNCLPDPTEEHLDEDVHWLEDMAAYLADSTEEERDALAAAAQRALEEEQAGAKRPDYLQVYGSWMECMFGDGWEGNRRV